MKNDSDLGTPIIIDAKFAGSREERIYPNYSPTLCASGCDGFYVLEVSKVSADGVPDNLKDWVWEIDGQEYLMRVRRLTPRECWRFMDFAESDFEKAEGKVSSTQLYKQAGNSIVKNVLCEVFSQLLDPKV